MKNIISRSSIYDPLNNFLFFKVMGEKGDEVQLLAFINAVLGKTGDDRFISIEILEDKTFTPDIIGINIVNFDFPATKHYHSSFHLREDTERDIILTNALEIHYINMVKYRKQGNENLNDPLCRWLIWFNKNSPPKLIEEVVKMDNAIQVAAERMLNLTVDLDVLTAYDKMFMAACDRTSEIDFALSKGMEKGLKKGMKKGMKQEKLIIAKNLLGEGSSTDFIQRITGLDLNTIEALRAQL